jgi:type II secretory pathway pseudopilin PulG
MIKLLPRLTNSKGDTIVEVLIAIVVVSLVMAGAYVLSNNSAKAIRTAQERGEALKLAESQAEQIKIAVDAGTVLPASFCFEGGLQQPSTNPLCIQTNGIPYQRSIAKIGSNNYVVKVQWDALAGDKNTVELDYRIDQ